MSAESTAAVADDDILDALAVVWTARRIHAGDAVCISEGVEERDQRGLPMRMLAQGNPRHADSGRLAVQVDRKIIRARLTLSPSQSALVIGVSTATLQNWEQGRERPRGRPARCVSGRRSLAMVGGQRIGVGSWSEGSSWCLLNAARRGRTEPRETVEMRSARVIVFLFGLMLALPYPGFAQETGGMVPEDLVRAILSRRGEEATILPGELPGTIESAVRFPESARLLGSVVFGPIASAYAVDTQPPDAIRAFFRAQLEANGWQASEAYRRTGFVADAPVAPVTFCSSDNRVITISATEQQAGTLIQLGYSEDVDMTPCQRQEQQRQEQGATRSSFQEMRDHMPVLRMPEGDVRRGGGGTGSGRQSNASFIEIETELTAAEIADHVATDLAADGWEPDAATTGNIAVIRAWTRTFDDGFRALGQLIILSIEPGRYDVTFNMTKLSGR